MDAGPWGILYRPSSSSRLMSGPADVTITRRGLAVMRLFGQPVGPLGAESHMYRSLCRLGRAASRSGLGSGLPALVTSEGAEDAVGGWPTICDGGRPVREWSHRER